MAMGVVAALEAIRLPAASVVSYSRRSDGLGALSALSNSLLSCFSNRESQVLRSRLEVSVSRRKGNCFAGVCCAAWQKLGEVESVELTGNTSKGFPAAPGVYAVFDKDGKLQYVGISRKVSSSIENHLQDLPELCGSVKVCVVDAPDKTALTEAWREWVQEYVESSGEVPPGNVQGITTWTARKQRSAKPEIKLTPGPHVTLTIPLVELIDKVVKGTNDVAFIKGTRTAPQCGFSHRVLSILSESGADNEVVNVLDEHHNPEGVVAGGVVALGKFDALHRGHRALAEQAARMGSPVLLSFAGMGEVLGWQPRLPVAAICDRRRIMSIWAQRCGGVIPQEYALDFKQVRALSPEEFVQKLATELHVSGVVAGANYRFGYKAAGDASDLVQLCNDHGLQAFIVDPVMDTSEVGVKNDEISGSSREKGQISSTRVRKALAKGDLQRVASLLGRKHRLVLSLESCRQERGVLIVPVSNALNQAPGEGLYDCTLVRTGQQRDTVNTSSQQDSGDDSLGVGQVKIGPEDIQITLVDNVVEQVLQRTRLGLEFPYG